MFAKKGMDFSFMENINSKTSPMRNLFLFICTHNQRQNNSAISVNGVESDWVMESTPAHRQQSVNGLG